MQGDLLAWLYWDPPREVFRVPFLDHPVVWYGVWFVLGFLFGYALLVPILGQKILFSEEIPESHVSDWRALVKAFQEAREGKKSSFLAKIVDSLDRKGRKALSSLKQGELPPPHLKASILDALNKALNSRTLCDQQMLEAWQGPKFVRKWERKIGILGDSNFRAWNRLLLERLLTPAVAQARHLSLHLVDRLTWFIVAGTIVGARLGHVFFYGWPYYQQHPIDIFKVWEGGLASHGGAVGVILALGCYWRSIRKSFPSLSFVGLLDRIAIPTAVTAVCIRIGNFFNQEILGPPTTVPWAVIFGHPVDRTGVVPRHPVQLYEAGCYLLTFLILFFYWRVGKERVREGILSGLFFVLVFVSRFFIEFWKLPQGVMIDESFLLTGQYLSLPFIALGFFLLFWGNRFSQGRQRGLFSAGSSL